MRYSIREFQNQFNTNEACLWYLFKKKYPHTEGFYLVKGRTSFANAAGRHIYPLKGTIFEKSRTPLNIWFYAIFVISSMNASITAKELQTHLGVTYKTAWRMRYKILTLIKSDIPTQKSSKLDFFNILSRT